MTLLQHELTDFKVNAFQNNEFHEVTKDDVLGHWSLFFFYPADFTFVCPTELEDLAKNYAKFKEIGCEIYSVSCDTHFVHKAWHDANEKIAKIEYPMLADPTALLAKDLDTYNEADGMAERGDFIVSPEGKVVAYEVISSNVGRNAEELLRRPGIRYEMIAKVIGRGEGVTPTMALRIETEIRYAGYIAREERLIRDIQRHENVKIPEDFDYSPIEMITLEAREKLQKIRPRTLAQAGRIPGVSPSDLSQLSLALLKAGRGE